jgi:hypothetical protein
MIYKHAVHINFPTLYEKRDFVRKFNKERHKGNVQIIDLGRDENGVGIEIAFKEKAMLDKFNSLINKNTKK